VDPATGKKLGAVWWERPDGSRGLGGSRVEDLPLFVPGSAATLAGLEDGAEVILTEGEPAAVALAWCGLAAAATVTGAATIPSDAVLGSLARFHVVVWPDADDPGVEHMQRIAARLVALGCGSVEVIEWPEAPARGDAADLCRPFGERREREGARAAVVALSRRPWSPPAPGPVEAPPAAIEPKVRERGSNGAPVGSMERRAVLTQLDTVRPERVTWLWQGRIPVGKLTLLDGDPDLGKSTLSLDLAARVSRGQPMPDGSPGVGPGDAILLNAEDGLADTIRPRLDAAGADCSRVSVLTVRTGETEDLPSIPDDLAALRQAITDRGALLAVVDPLMAYLGGDVNSHRDQDVRRALAPLARIAEETGCAVLVLRHNNKGQAPNVLHRGGGSIGIIGAARSGLVVGHDPEDETRTILAVAKSNLGPKLPSLAFRIVGAPNEAGRVNWLGATAHTAKDLLGAPPSDEERSQTELACEVLREVLAAGPVEAKQARREVEDGAGVSPRTVDRVKARLGVIAEREGFGRGGRWVWRLPHRTPANPIERNPTGMTPYGDSRRSMEEPAELPADGGVVI
jgi:hypothetical protein